MYVLVPRVTVSELLALGVTIATPIEVRTIWEIRLVCGSTRVVSCLLLVVYS